MLTPAKAVRDLVSRAFIISSFGRVMGRTTQPALCSATQPTRPEFGGDC